MDISNMEKRTFHAGPFVVETREETGERKIVGHAAVFDLVAGPRWFRERIEPGAFKDSLKEDDIRALFNHDPNLVLGRNTNGTLTLEEDDKGLFMTIVPPDTQAGRDVMSLISRGDISQASFAFQTLEESWEEGEKEDVRVLKKVKLYDVSPVTYPFYEATDVALRSHEHWKKTQAIQPQKRRRPWAQHIHMVEHY